MRGRLETRGKVLLQARCKVSTDAKAQIKLRDAEVIENMADLFC